MGPKKRKPLIRNLINILLVTIVLSVLYVLYTIVYDFRVRIINKSELKDIAGINTIYSERFDRFVTEIERNTEWKVLVISGLRTKDEQIQLKRDNPRNASFKKSRHVLGRAIDINLYKRVGLRVVWLKKGSSIASWRQTNVHEIAKKHRLLWGGTYKTYHGPVHFEIN
jgi:hypothetical protein